MRKKYSFWSCGGCFHFFSIQNGNKSSLVSWWPTFDGMVHVREFVIHNVKITTSICVEFLLELTAICDEKKKFEGGMASCKTYKFKLRPSICWVKYEHAWVVDKCIDNCVGRHCMACNCHRLPWISMKNVKIVLVEIKFFSTWAALFQTAVAFFLILLKKENQFRLQWKPKSFRIDFCTA